MEWNPLNTMPKNGRFLIGVWEGTWEEPKKEFHIYEAYGFRGSREEGFRAKAVFGRKGDYRTDEGQAYEIVCWMPLPEPPCEF